MLGERLLPLSTTKRPPLTRWLNGALPRGFNIVSEGLDGIVTRFWILFQGLEQDLVEARRCAESMRTADTAFRNSASKHPVEYCAEAVDIGPFVDVWITVRLFRCHEPRGAEYCLVDGQAIARRRIQSLCQAKVAHFHA